MIDWWSFMVGFGVAGILINILKIVSLRTTRSIDWTKYNLDPAPYNELVVQSRIVGSEINERAFRRFDKTANEGVNK